MLVAALFGISPIGWLGLNVSAYDGCSVTDEVRATTCRLLDGQTSEGTLDATTGSATYRLDVFAPDASLDLIARAEGGGATVTVLDWHDSPIGESALTSEKPEAHLTASLPLPGTYGVRIVADDPSSAPSYRLGASLKYQGVAWQPFWPVALATGDGPLTGERQIARTPRGGTPEGGVAVARALGTPPEGEVGDFTLVTDVQFERVLGPSALTIRFRYEPEAGGGTGYLLYVDPFGGTATLDSFDEGRRRPIVDKMPLAVLPTEATTNRLVLHAEGPSIRVSLDGQTVLEATDDKFSGGLIAVGAVTWSDPVAVTFDHIQVTTPPR
jgi:hypothetical protein